MNAAGKLIGVLRQPELALVALMAAVIGMLVMPLPTWLVDALIALNMAIAIVIFLSSFYVERLLDFSSFPSVLLFTTLMRLALSVSTSRLILVDADAGHVIRAFGDFVIADNLVVGFVVFAIVTIVQFIVITKGAERVGEVTARFSLDGMPGKQMAIDADLRSEAINGDEAQRRRREVERESQLFGSFDGAMKFVKGDAIAGVVIVLVNLFGGIAVGMLQHGMRFNEALRTFTLLTIGDGLVAQIPALLICISAGFVVTRVSGERRNLGAGIIAELFASPLVLGVAAALVLLMGTLPGFPLPAFGLLSAGLLLAAKRLISSGGVVKEAGVDSRAVDASPSKARAVGPWAAETVPLLLCLAPVLRQRVEDEKWVERSRERCFLQLGITLPMVALRDIDDAGYGAEIWVHEVLAVRGQVVPNHRKVSGPPDVLALFPQSITPDPGRPGEIWLAGADVVRLEAMGGASEADEDVLFQLLQQALTRNITELFGIQETKQLMDGLEARVPELVKETWRHMPVQRLADVLQRLLAESISIRNMKLILESLAQWAQREKDVIMLVEHARGALCRYISAGVARDGRVKAIILSPVTEDLVRSGVRQAQGGSYFTLDPAKSMELGDRIAMHVGEVARHCPHAVLLVAVDVRRFIKRFIESRLPDLSVISYGEISDTVSVDVLRTI